MATLPDVVEPLHQCSSRCRFELDSRRCLTSGNVHRCSRTCVIVDAEGHYVCTLLGLVLRDFMLPASPPRTQRRRNTVKVKSHKPWIREAAEIFLATDRTDLILSARRRATAKIRKQLGLVTPSLRGSMSAFQKILGNLSAQRSMNFPLPVHLCEPVLDELCLAFGEFWERVGHQAFSLTKQSVYTYTAVMIENLAEGVKDSHGSIIIPRSEIIRLHCPNTVDYVKLCGVVSCKGMSTGFYKLKCCCLHGQGRVKYGHTFVLPPLLRPGACDNIRPE